MLSIDPLKYIPVEIMQFLTKEYRSSSLGLIGCRGNQESHPCCEFDIITTGLSESISRKNIAGHFLNLYLINEELSKNLRKEELYHFLHLRIISDGNFILAPLCERIERVGHEVIQKEFSLMRFIDSSSTIQKAKDAKEREELLDSAFWTLSSGYALSESIISSSGMSVHPTHLLDMLKRQMTKIDGLSADPLYQCLGLVGVTKTSLNRRMRGLDSLILSTLQVQQGTPESIYLWIKLIKRKINWMMDSHMVSQAHNYLGYEFVRNIEMIYSSYCNANGIPPHHSRIISEILENGERPYRIPTSILKMIDLRSDQDTIEKNLSFMISTLEKFKSKMFQK